MAGERTLPGLGLTGFWDLGSPYKAGMDSNLRSLSALVQCAAISRTTALPGTGSLGDIYIVPDTDGTNPDKIAVWDGPAGTEAWVYLTPAAGWLVYVEDESTHYRYDGAAWAEFTTGSGGGGSLLGGTYPVEVSSSPATIANNNFADGTTTGWTTYTTGTGSLTVTNGAGADGIPAHPLGLYHIGKDPAGDSLQGWGFRQTMSLASGTVEVNFSWDAADAFNDDLTRVTLTFLDDVDAEISSVEVTRTTAAEDTWESFETGNITVPVGSAKVEIDVACEVVGGAQAIVGYTNFGLDMLSHEVEVPGVGAGSGQSYPLGFATATPPTGTWTLDNEEPAEGVTETNYVDGGTVEMKVQGSNEHWVYHTPLAGAGTFDVVGRIGYSVPTDDFAAAGMVVGAGTNYLQIGVHWDNTFVVKKHSGHVFDSESFYSPFAPALAGTLYYRAVGDGTDVTLYVSEDGLAWTSVFTEPFTTFLGGAPDVCGVWIDTAAVTATEVVTVTCRGLDFDGPQPEAAARDGIAVSIREATGTTYAASDADLAGNVIRKLNDASAITVDVPPGLTGTEPCTFVQAGAGQITFAPGAGVTINSADGALTTRVQYSNAVLIPDGVDTFLLVGDITT